MPLRRTLPIALLALAALAAPAPAAAKDMVTGVLEGRRASLLVCELINKSGDVLSGAELTLKAPDGSAIGSPFPCPALAHGETCVLEHEIAFPSLDLAAYCHAELPKVFVRGALRLLDKNRNTLAESDLEVDLHGKVGALEARLELLATRTAPTVTVAFIDHDSDDEFDADGPDELIAKIVDTNLDNVASPGDLLVVERYPLDLAASATGLFRHAPLVCNNVAVFLDVVTCVTDEGSFSFESSAERDEFDHTSSDVLIRDTKAPTTSDFVQALFGSVLDPVPPLTAIVAFDNTDNDFIDVVFGLQ